MLLSRKFVLEHIGVFRTQSNELFAEIRFWPTNAIWHHLGLNFSWRIVYMEAHQFKAYVISNIMEGVFFISATDSLFSIKAVRLIRNCLLHMMKYVKTILHKKAKQNLAVSFSSWVLLHGLFFQKQLREALCKNPQNLEENTRVGDFFLIEL